MLILALEYNILKNYVSKHNLHIYKEYRFNLKKCRFMLFYFKMFRTYKIELYF